jgi:hypothetical protein
MGKMTGRRNKNKYSSNIQRQLELRPRNAIRLAHPLPCVRLLVPLIARPSKKNIDKPIFHRDLPVVFNTFPVKNDPALPGSPTTPKHPDN